MDLSRRQLFGKSLGLGAGFAGLLSAKNALAAMCGLTPPQTIGPFYPENNPLDDQNNDLTVISGAHAAPLGTVIYVTGQVTDADCRPVKDALVEIWQAAASGRYNHSGDTSGLALDPNFGYWGEMKTDAKGIYVFKTILPGYYPADVDWIRPPHIHFKITRRGYHDLITQMYFTKLSFSDVKLGEKIAKLNQDDFILKKVAEKDRVVITYAEADLGTVIEFERTFLVGGVPTTFPGKFVTKKNERMGRFDIALKSARD